MTGLRTGRLKRKMKFETVDDARGKPQLEIKRDPKKDRRVDT